MITSRREFQDSVEASIRRSLPKYDYTSGDEVVIPAHPGDYGFHYPDIAYIEMVAQVLERSNFSAWPDSGGLNDQDWNLIQDALTWLAVRDWLEFAAKHPDSAAMHDRPAIGDDVVKLNFEAE